MVTAKERDNHVIGHRGGCDAMEQDDRMTVALIECNV
jgi:hypothetical protein